MSTLQAEKKSGEYITTVICEPIKPLATVTAQDKKTGLSFYCSCQKTDKKRYLTLLIKEVGVFSELLIVECPYCNTHYRLYPFETEITEIAQR